MTFHEYERDFSAEEIIKIIEKLNGHITPDTGDSDRCCEAQENLEAMIKILDWFIDSIVVDVLGYENSYDYEAKRVGQTARRWVEEKRELFDEYKMEKEDIKQKTRDRDDSYDECGVDWGYL